MGKRWTWVAWSMLAIYLVGAGVGMALMVANGEFQRDPGGQASLLLAFTAFMVMGAVIVAHRPGNAIGWIFSAIGLLTGTGFFAWQYAEYAYVTRGSPLPGALLSAWYNSWWWSPTLILATTVTVLVFPTGRLLSARWRPVAWMTAAITATVVAVTALAPTLDLGQRTELRNPIGLAGMPSLERSALRRFNRRNYDAAKTIEAFSARLRDEVDLDALSAELLAVTNLTMQPTAASLWLRPSLQRSRYPGT